MLYKMEIESFSREYCPTFT